MMNMACRSFPWGTSNKCDGHRPPLHLKMPFFAIFIEHPHPFLFRIGENWGIRFYSLAYLTGFYVLFVGLRWQAKRGWSLLRGDAISDYVTWVAMVGVILGGRPGYF